MKTKLGYLGNFTFKHPNEGPDNYAPRCPYCKAELDVLTDEEYKNKVSRTSTATAPPSATTATRTTAPSPSCPRS